MRFNAPFSNMAISITQGGTGAAKQAPRATCAMEALCLLNANASVRCLGKEADEAPEIAEKIESWGLGAILPIADMVGGDRIAAAGSSPG